ncbi:antibiotic biosynthesis monooxygenase [Rhizobium leguminosarum]|uniref:putative quinol monooxygenase n=1 Tax=Rhizobium leguminosarum TaxID=384 RepID=UPI001C901170|nr:putative quinol monooxygenase [Rhizobium leguminosarum]MBY2924362.1 antibiotic biosynthesis monooxygenase [Rhizobium leguminosarum]
MLIVTGYVQVEPTELAQFCNEFSALATATRRRSGNLSYSAAVDDPQDGRLLVVEQWEDQASLSAHLEAADTVAFVDRWRGRMLGNIEKYDASNKRGLMD